jgi:hypothetical protein
MMPSMPFDCASHQILFRQAKARATAAKQWRRKPITIKNRADRAASAGNASGTR